MDWDKCYANNTQLSVWPWSDVVSLVNRHCKPVIELGGGRILELGCGAGANIPFFRALGMDYYAVEGSSTIVSRLHQRYPELSKSIRIGDFTVEQPFEGLFDLVIDRAAVTHNSENSIKNTLRTVLASLKLGGVFIGCDWFSINHTDYLNGERGEDKYTRTNFNMGQFNGVGKVHFSDELHLRELFSNFEIIFLEEKIIKRFQPQDDHKIAAWNVVVRRVI
jgi:SAM-dependent methyltransferase